MTPIPGYPGYFATEAGEIFSTRRKKAPALLRTSENAKGYLRVRLSTPEGFFNRSVHRLVLLTFRGPAPEGHEGGHLNGDCRDNRSVNLAWVTPHENLQHKIGHGNVLRGEDCGSSKLSNAQVSHLRSLRGVKTNSELATIFGVSTRYVEMLMQGKWRISDGQALLPPGTKGE